MSLIYFRSTTKEMEDLPTVTFPNDESLLNDEYDILDKLDPTNQPSVTTQSKPTQQQQTAAPTVAPLTNAVPAGGDVEKEESQQDEGMSNEETIILLLNNQQALFKLLTEGQEKLRQVVTTSSNDEMIKAFKEVTQRQHDMNVASLAGAMQSTSNLKVEVTAIDKRLLILEQVAAKNEMGKEYLRTVGDLYNERQKDMELKFFELKKELKKESPPPPIDDSKYVNREEILSFRKRLKALEDREKEANKQSDMHEKDIVKMRWALNQQTIDRELFVDDWTPEMTEEEVEEIRRASVDFHAHREKEARKSEKKKKTNNKLKKAGVTAINVKKLIDDEATVSKKDEKESSEEEDITETAEKEAIELEESLNVTKDSKDADKHDEEAENLLAKEDVDTNDADSEDEKRREKKKLKKRKNEEEEEPEIEVVEPPTKKKIIITSFPPPEFKKSTVTGPLEVVAKEVEPPKKKEKKKNPSKSAVKSLTLPL